MTHRQAMSTPDVQPSSTPVGRSAAFERGVVTLVGLLLLAAGAAALLVGSGWLGTYRAQRPVLDPLVGRWLREQPQWATAVAAVLGVLLLVLGVWWVSRAARREARPDVRWDVEQAGTTTVTASAITEAVRADAESVTGVTRARVRMAGSHRRPSLQLTLSLQEGTHVRHVWEELEAKVLSRAREALETEVVPTAIRLKLDRSPRQRVR